MVTVQSGERLGRYTLMERISEGFPGPRWAAHDGSTAPDRLLSLRRLETDRLGDPEAVHRLASAAFWAMDLAHDHVHALKDVVATGGQLALVGPYVEGETLRAALRRAHRERTPFPPGVVVRIGLDLLQGLRSIQQAANRDGDPECMRYAAGGINPDGVLIGLDGVTRVIDAGVSAVASAEPAWTRDPVRAGYHAPERFGGMPLDGRSDIFVLGVVIWEMLALEHLFPGLRSEHVAEALWAREIPPLHDVARGADLPWGMAEVVHRALEREPEDRFQDYTELESALQALNCCATSVEVGDFVRAVGGRLARERRERLGTEAR